jgi:PAS domain S-box-containing protein
VEKEMTGSEKSLSHLYKLKRYILALAVVWTIIVAISLIWHSFHTKKETMEAARIQARVAYEKDIIYRRWNAGHGGVYVPVTKETQPNPYLSDVPERDITTPSGKSLTLMNPAYMTRQAHELEKQKLGVRGHITSLNPIRPENAPDPWETEALRAFGRGETEISSVDEIQGKKYMRLMRPLITEKGCLKCHAKQGYHEGDIRGGISVSIPMEHFLAFESKHIQTFVLIYGLLWMVGLVGIGLGTQRLMRTERERERAEQELQKAHDELERKVEERTAELKKAIEAIRGEQTFTKDVVNTLTDVFFVFDLKGQFIRWNKSLGSVSGYSDDEISSMKPIDFFKGENINRISQAINMIVKEGFATVEAEVITKDGMSIPFEFTGSLLRDYKGNTLGICGIGRNISERKLAEEKLRLNAQRMEALLKLNQMTQNTIQEITHFALEEAISLTESKIGYIAFMNEEETLLTMHAWSKSAMEECRILNKPILYPVETTGLWGEAVRQRKPIITNDYVALNPLKKGYPEGHVHLIRHMNVPVFDGEHIVVVAGVGNKLTEYDESDVMQLTLFMTGMWQIIQRKHAEEEIYNLNIELEQKVIERTAQLKAANEELQQEIVKRKQTGKERDRLFNLSIDMLCIAGFDGYFKQLNPAWEKTVGWTNKELMSKPFIEFVHPEDVKATINTARGLSEGKAVFIFENRYLCKDGSYKWISWSSFPLVEEELIFAVTRDVTEHKKLEQSLKERTEQLEDMNKELELKRQESEEARLQAEAATRAKSEFLANMSHELRTPLNAVIGFSEIMKDGMAGPLNESQKEYLNDIYESGKHLLSLINDILDLSKIEAGKIELDLSAFNVREFIDSILVMFREKVIKHNFRIRTEIEEGIKDIVADERRIKQVLFNLLSNAMKFTPDGGSITVRARKVKSSELGVRSEPLDLSLRGEAEAISEDEILPPKQVRGQNDRWRRAQDDSIVKDYIEITVEDTGIGISEEDQKKLFQPFQQLETTLEKKYAGTGLGLALSKRFVKLHGGKIWVESEVGKGSKFVFVIPIKQDAT